MAPGATAPLTDVHVHLPAYPDPSTVVESASRSGIRLISVTVSPEEAVTSLRLKRETPTAFRAFIGVHPSEAESTPSGIEELSPLWESADGVGEVGLDPKYSEVSAKSAQMRLFEGQVAVAARLHKPLEVHSRGAEGKCLDVLEGYSPPSVLMHWFEGEEFVERVLSRPRCFVSFGPALLYSKKLARVAKRLPPDAVLTESDGPVAFAALGGPAGPGLVPSVAFRLAELWGMRFEDAAHQLSVNFDRFLG